MCIHRRFFKLRIATSGDIPSCPPCHTCKHNPMQQFLSLRTITWTHGCAVKISCRHLDTNMMEADLTWAQFQLENHELCMSPWFWTCMVYDTGSIYNITEVLNVRHDMQHVCMLCFSTYIYISPTWISLRWALVVFDQSAPICESFAFVVKQTDICATFVSTP